MRDLLVALTPDWLGFKNTFLRGGGERRISSLVGIAFIVLFTVFIAAGTARVTPFARGMFADYPGLLGLIEINVLSAVSLAAFVLLLMTGIRGIYSSYYESGDMAFLLSTPLRVEAVFFSKLLKSIMSNLLLLLPFSGAVWIGYGIAQGASLLFYVVTVVSLLLVAAIFTALSSVLVMMIMRFVPGQKLKQMMLVGSLAVSLVFVFGTQYLNSTLNMSDDPEQTRAFLESVGRWKLDTTGYLPHIWLTKTMLRFAGTHAFGFGESLLPLAVVGLVSVFAAAALARHTFLTGWSSSQESGGRRRSIEPSDVAIAEKGGPAAGRSAAVSRAASSFDAPPGVMRGIIRKDMKLLARTPMVWYSVAVAIIVMGFMTYNVVQNMDTQDVTGAPGELTGVILLFMTMVMGASMNARSGAFSVSLEGKSWWMIKSMPIEPGVYYFAKQVYGFVTSSVIGIVIVLGMSAVPGVPIPTLYISIPTVIAVGSVVAAVSLLFDILYPDFDLGGALDSASGRSRSGGSMGKLMGVMLGSMGIVVVLGAVFAFPLYHGNIRFTAWMSPVVAKACAAAAFAAVILVVNWLCYRVGTRKLATVFLGVE